jgi:hypothetical protein
MRRSAQFLKAKKRGKKLGGYRGAKITHGVRKAMAAVGILSEMYGPPRSESGFLCELVSDSLL